MFCSHNTTLKVSVCLHFNMSEISETTKAEFLKFKSNAIYLRWYNDYKKFLDDSGPDIKENPYSVLDYLSFLSKDYAASTLWQAYSCINKYFKILHNVNLNDCSLIRDFLKKGDFEHLKKKSDIFNSDQVKTFLDEYKNDNNELIIKCCLVIALHGLMRISELINLDFSDCKEVGDMIFKIIIKRSKTDKKGEGFNFFINGYHASFVKNYI
jgi:site-specific recombinase XerD